MLSLVNFINNFKKDLISAENKDECKKFFFKSNLHLMISLEIASSSILDEKINYTMLKSIMPSSLTSGNKLKSILDEGVKKKFFIKKNYFNKNKTFYYKISRKYSLMITNWYLDNKSKLN
tara:strand:- start:394 stop:753 length:360 start_codon:yes stop_codon:yes gene_type:complete